MAEIRGAANGEIFRGGTKIKSASGKTYVVSGLSSENVAYDNSQSSLDAATVQEAIDKIAELLPGQIENWRQVQDVVRRGLASSYFDIGDTFEVKKGQSTLLFDLIGIDEDVPATSTATISGSGITAVDVDYFALLKHEGTAGDFEFNYHNNAWRDSFGDTVTLSNYGISTTGTAAEGDTISVSIPHSITLKLHDTSATESIVFDAPECTLYLNPNAFPNGLAAGTYHFEMNNKTYQFTLTTSISSGGALRINTSTTKIAAFNDVSQERATVSVSYTEGAGGTLLSDLSPIECARSDRQNGLNQSQYGLNEYSESCIRQLINTRLASGWWEAQSGWDRPGNTSKAGFLNNVDTEFLGVIKPVFKKTKKSQAYGADIVITQEKVFLLSISEVYGGTNISGDEGEPYSWFGVGSSSLPSPGSGADTNRIIKSGNTAKSYWLRSRFPSDPKSTQVAVVKADGSINAILAYNTVIAAVPCCVIY